MTTKPQEYQLTDPPTDGISTVSFSPRDDLLLVSSWDSAVRVFDVVRNQLRASYNHKAGVLDCCFSDIGHCFSGGLDLQLKMFELNTRTEVILGEHKQPIRCVGYTQQENLIVTGSWDSTIKLWDTRSPTPCIGTYNQQGRVFTMALSGHRVIVGTSTRQVLIWDLRRMGEVEQRRESSLKFQTRCIRAFIEGDGYALSSTEGRVAMEYFDPSPQIQAKKYAFKCHRVKSAAGMEHVYPVGTMAFHPILGTFATGGDDGTINIWDGKNKKRLCQLRKYPTSISSVSFNHDGSLLAIASSYTFFEGDKGNTPEAIFIRTMSEAEVKPKAKTK